MSVDFELIVLGGGAAGLGAARAAVRAGRTVAMVVDGPVGGDCTFTGCVPSKTLIESAAAGLPYARAIERVHETVAHIASTEAAHVLRGEGIEIIEGRAAFRDPHRIAVDGQVLVTERSVIATGSNPLVPQALAGNGTLTTDTFWTRADAPESLAIVGGGAVGCELAQAMARFGVSVTIVEAADRLLPLEEPDASAVIHRALEGDGVDIRLKTTVECAGSDGLVLADGGRVAAERVLVAIGRTPDIAELALESAGVETDARGYVVTDDKLRTSTPGIYAAGDVTGRMPFTHAADAMGRLAARNAFGKAGHRFDSSAIPAVTFTAPEVARVGLREDQTAGRDAQVAYLPLTEVDRAITAGATDGFVKIIAGSRRGAGRVGGGRIIGATIVAPRAGEMIGELALAMRTGMFTGRLAQTVHAYPTYSIAIQQAVAQFFMTIGGRAARPAQV